MYAVQLQLALPPLHIGIHEQATVELPGVKGCWSLRTGDAAVSDTYLVMSFIGETRILAINDEDELDETEFDGFSAEEQTLVRRWRCARRARLTHGL